MSQLKLWRCLSTFIRYISSTAIYFLCVLASLDRVVSFLVSVIHTKIKISPFFCKCDADSLRIEDLHVYLFLR